MGYVDYSFYTETYKGSAIPETAFGNLALKAESLVDTYTFNRISKSAPYMNKVKLCCCEIAELLFKAEKEDNNGIASEKVGEYSVTYVSAETKERLTTALTNSIINNWLALTGLLYRGC